MNVWLLIVVFTAWLSFPTQIAGEAEIPIQREAAAAPDELDDHDWSGQKALEVAEALHEFATAWLMIIGVVEFIARAIAWLQKHCPKRCKPGFCSTIAALGVLALMLGLALASDWVKSVGLIAYCGAHVLRATSEVWAVVSRLARHARFRA